MLLWIIKLFSSHWGFLRVFNHVSFRSILSILTTLLITILFSPKFIRYLACAQISQSVRDDGPQSHLQKSGTPTMGGIVILIAITISMLLWGDLNNHFFCVVLLTTLGFGFLGWTDDYLKVIHKNGKGISAKLKFFWQSMIAMTAVSFLYCTIDVPEKTAFTIPFFKKMDSQQLGFFYIVIEYFVLVGASNAVNLTDGLDGLAVLPAVLIAFALGVFACITGHSNFSSYFGLSYIPGVGEITVFCSGLVGAGLGFLWYNSYPAQVFMGDVGSLSIGAALGSVAVVVHQELVFFIMGGIFVVETLSVIIQVVSCKIRKKRIFRMAPLHHHFELKGWPEPKVTVRFWIVTIILVLLGLATLKLR